MFYNSIRLKNFTVFKDVLFVPGQKLNIIVGENGSGKSHFLKVVNAFYPSEKGTFDGLCNTFGLNSFYELIRDSEEITEISAFYDNDKYHDYLKIHRKNGVSSKTQSDSSKASNCVFIDFDRVLSYNEKKTFGVSPEYKKIAGRLEKAINGKIVSEKYEMYLKTNGFDISLQAAGHGEIQIATLAHLIMTRKIYKGSVLAWDNPDIGLNPKLIRLLCECLFELSQNGVQVFLSTHNLFMMTEFDFLIKRCKTLSKQDVKFFNFHRDGTVTSGISPEELDDIMMFDESILQSDRYLKMD